VSDFSREHSKPLIKLGIEIHVPLKSLSIIFTTRLYQLSGRAVSFFQSSEVFENKLFKLR